MGDDVKVKSTFLDVDDVCGALASSVHSALQEGKTDEEPWGNDDAKHQSFRFRQTIMISQYHL